METSMLIFLALWWLDYDKLWHLVINLVWLVTYSLKKRLSNYSFMCWWNALTTCGGYFSGYEENWVSSSLSCYDNAKVTHGPWPMDSVFCSIPLFTHITANPEAQDRLVMFFLPVSHCVFFAALKAVLQDAKSPCHNVQEMLKGCWTCPGSAVVTSLWDTTEDLSDLPSWQRLLHIFTEITGITHMSCWAETSKLCCWQMLTRSIS